LQLHTSLIGGHSGFLKTYQRIKKDFFLEILKTDIQNFLVECLVFQQNKGENQDLGYFTTIIHTNAALGRGLNGFIIGLPKSEGKNFIVVVLD
jgi:hypothetical protein